MNIKNYYKVLDLPFHSSQKDIKYAFRKQVKIWHPDVNDSKDSNIKTIEIYEAYDILSDVNKRKQYDIIYNKIFVIKEDYLDKSKVDLGSDVHFNKSNESLTKDEFNDLNIWIREARKKSDELLRNGLKVIDTSINIGVSFFNLFSYVLGFLGFFAAIAYTIEGVKDLIDIFTVKDKFSIVGLISSLLGSLFLWFILYFIFVMGIGYIKSRRSSFEKNNPKY